MKKRSIEESSVDDSIQIKKTKQSWCLLIYIIVILFFFVFMWQCGDSVLYTNVVFNSNKVIFNDNCNNDVIEVINGSFCLCNIVWHWGCLMLRDVMGLASKHVSN